MMMLSKCLEKISKDSQNPSENIILIGESLRILEYLQKSNS